MRVKVDTLPEAISFDPKERREAERLATKICALDPESLWHSESLESIRNIKAHPTNIVRAWQAERVITFRLSDIEKAVEYEIMMEGEKPLDPNNPALQGAYDAMVDAYEKYQLVKRLTQ